MTLPELPRTATPGPDFGRLWAATATSQVGTGLALGAMALVAIEVLAVTDLQVSVMFAVAGLVSAALALPLGSWVEHRRKRPVLVAANVLRALALASVPLAHVLGVLTYAQLVVVASISSFGLLLEIAASTAHLKGLVPLEARTTAASRLETTSWLSLSIGPAVGGALMGAIGATVTLAINAVTFLAAALGLRRLRSPEPEPPALAPEHRWRSDLPTGWRFLLGHPTLRPLFWNAMLFGAMVIASSPLLMVLMLRELGLAPWQYGLALGLPCVGGIAGAALAPWLERRVARPGRVLVVLGALRTLWLLPMAFAPPGVAGMVVIIACDTLMLLCAGAFNPLFVAHRMGATPDHLMARTSSAWSITNRVLQPVATLLAGALALLTSTRLAVAVLGVGLLLSCALLPWRDLWRSPGQPSVAQPAAQAR